MFLLSADISTKTIGYSIFDIETQNLIDIDFISYSNKDISLFQKVDLFEEKIKNLNNVKFIAIEEPIKKMSGNFTNTNTLYKLSSFNSMISYLLYKKYNVEPYYIDVNYARKLVFPNLKLVSKEIKKDIWNLVKDEINKTWIITKKGVLKPENYDMTDSYVIGRAFFMILNNQKNG